MSASKSTQPWLVTFWPGGKSEYQRRAMDADHVRELATLEHGVHRCFLALNEETGEQDDCRKWHEATV
jgi:hypothetical protein